MERHTSTKMYLNNLLLFLLLFTYFCWFLLILFTYSSESLPQSHYKWYESLIWRWYEANLIDYIHPMVIIYLSDRNLILEGLLRFYWSALTSYTRPKFISFDTDFCLERIFKIFSKSGSLLKFIEVFRFFTIKRIYSLWVVT